MPPCLRSAVAIIIAWQLTAPLAAQDTSQAPEQKTPPPRGTTTFTPVPSVKEQPLISETFAVRAAAASQAEIELGQLALKRSDDPQVRQFAQRMIKDHEAANAKLKAVAATDKVSLPATADQEHLQLKNDLAQLSGAAFDQKYIQTMLDDHAAAVALFEAAASSAQVDEELRVFANALLPTLKEHGAAAHALHQRNANQ